MRGFVTLLKGLTRRRKFHFNMPEEIVAVKCVGCGKLLDKNKDRYILIGRIAISQHHLAGAHVDRRKRHEVDLVDMVACNSTCLADRIELGVDESSR